MTKQIKVIRMGRAMGKTTKALQLLEAQGGGVFVTNHPASVTALARKLDLPRVKVLSLEMHIGYQIVIDDADELEVTLVTSNPLELREV